MKRVKFYINLLWRPVLGGLALLILSLVLLLSKPMQVPGGYSEVEVTYYNSINQENIFKDNPAYLPIKLIHKTSLFIFNNSLNTLRATNAILGLISVIILYFVIKSWYTSRVALLSSILYLTFTWFLVNTRMATPQIALLFSGLIPLLIIWNQNTKKQKFVLMISAISFALLIYIPGLIWLILLGVIWKYKSILYFLRNSPIWHVLSAFIVFALLLIPFVLNISNKEFIYTITGINPSAIGFTEFIKNVYTFIINLFWNSSFNNPINIGTQAILDIFSIVLLITGFIYVANKWGKSRSKFMIFSTIISLFLIGIGDIPRIIILPFIILLISSGILWLLRQWLTVFPKNPFARNIGVIIVVIAVLMSSIYNLYRFYVAWPHMKSTEITYTVRT